MKRVNQIIQHPVYKKELDRLQNWEKDRIFCNHTLEHFLDVARIMYIRSLENKNSLKKDVIYAAALLHDIGRGLQYSVGIPHDQASAELAGEILPECGYDRDEIDMIVGAIVKHRQSKRVQTTDNAVSSGEICPEEASDAQALSTYLYDADKKSRNCFSCQAFDECNWSAEKKNLEILI